MTQQNATIMQQSANHSSVQQFVSQLMAGELPALPDNLNGHSFDCKWLLTQAQKHQERDSTTRATIMQRIIGDYRKKTPSFDETMRDVAILPATTPTYPPLPSEAQLPTGMLPRVSPWLTRYIEYSKAVSPEGFKDYHIGCGLWVLSTAAARRIQVPLSDPVITPLSIIMVGRTSLFAKTTTAKAAIRLLKSADLGFLLGADETTPQKLLQKMSGNIPANYGHMSADRREFATKRIAMAGQVGWYYDEFNQLINAMTRPGPMAEFAGLLRKLDNCADEYSYETKSGEDHIKNPYLALLASTTPANIARHADRGAEFWNDGLWARMIFLAPHPNDFVTETMDDGIVTPPQELIDTLVQWNRDLGIPNCWINETTDEKGNSTGIFTCEVDQLQTHSLHVDKGVIKAFATYRQALRQLIAERNQEHGNSQDLDGSYSRLPTIALRIAALIASLEHRNVISLEVWSLAQELAELFRENLHRLYEQVSQPIAEDSKQEDQLIEYMKKKAIELTAREITQYGPFQKKINTEGIRSLLISLERSGIVTCRREGRKELFSLVS